MNKNHFLIIKEKKKRSDHVRMLNDNINGRKREKERKRETPNELITNNEKEMVCSSNHYQSFLCFNASLHGIPKK